jgi:3-hydroxyacyl-CoA dehydrogenase/enoyl-CoA hydratase/3-hydroxybutyryl-CoA epimerase
MMLVEIVIDPDATELTAPAAAFVARSIGCRCRSRVRRAFVNRVLAPYLMAAMRCVDEGIAPETVDEAALAFGMPMGPIELADTVGLDICVAVGKMLPPTPRRPETDRARRGGTPRPQDQAWLLRLRERKPAKSAPGAAPAGLIDRLIAPYVAEARAALAEGIVADGDLVDAGAVFGTGFALPRRSHPLRRAQDRVARAQCRRLLV